MTVKYKDLDADAKSVVDTVKAEFADLFDNDDFGPFIEEFTGFGDDRYAQLLELAVGDVEIVVGLSGLMWGINSFPYNSVIARRCIVLALTIEVIRHLMRSYVEIPDTSRVGAPDIVRRDYLSRWQGLLNDYQQQLKDAGKKLTAELYNQEGASHQKVLVDLASMRGIVNVDAPVERPQFGWWW